MYKVLEFIVALGLSMVAAFIFTLLLGDFGC